MRQVCWFARRAIGGLLLAPFVLLAACRQSGAEGRPALAMETATPFATAAAAAPAVETSTPADSEVVLRRFVERINAGDREAVAALFAPDARFDSIGRIYVGRDQIMERFLIPEVINLGGQYTILGIAQGAPAITVSFDFQAGSLVELFTYRCVVRNRLIQECVGRYGDRATPPAPPTGAGSNLAQELPAGARCYVDAVNAQQLDDLVGCFASDGVVVDVTRRIVGGEAIRAWADREVMGGTLQVLAVDQQQPGHTRLLVHWAPRGSQGWRAFYTFEEQDGSITLADLQYA